MTEPRHIHRMPPCSKYDFAKTQAWIEDMYAKGWHLEKDSYVFGTFEFIQSEPKRIRCRLEATDTQGGMFSDTHQPDPDQRTLYHELGWQWVGRRGQFQIYITDDPAAPELHTDPRIQAESIKALTKFLRTGISNSMIHFLILYFLTWRYNLSLALVALGFWPSVLFAASLLSLEFIQLWHCFKFYRLRKQLEQGIPSEQRKDYRHGLLPRLGYAVFTIAAWGVFLNVTFTQYDRSIALTEWTEPLPFATMQAVFPEAQLDYSQPIVESGFIKYSDWFIPESYEYYEYADVILPDGTSFYGSYAVYYHETKFEWFAERLAVDYMGRANGSPLDRLFQDEEIEIRTLENLDADLAVTWTDHSTFILLQKDNKVIQVRYLNLYESHFGTPEEMAQLILDSIQ